MAMNTGSLSDPLSPGGGSLGLVAGRRVAECRTALLGGTSLMVKNCTLTQFWLRFSEENA